MRSLTRKTISIIAALAATVTLMAQPQQKEQSDSLVRLLKSQSVQSVDVEGGRYRRVIGPARFLHNDTYLLCDTALWNVETNIIDAWGNVSILQDETVLTSDNLVYLVDQDLAQFRGAVVQLTDKDHNTLRTRHLDYNTKDSVAIFMNGGAMRDKDGQIIESRNGTYDSKISTFTFENDVNMFTDSIFVVTRDLVYQSDYNLAVFGRGTNAWKDDNMLSSEAGWYDRGRELFLFKDNVHVMSVDQEGWCDSLYFDRLSTGVELLGNAQVTDTTRNVFALAGRIVYVDSASRVTLTRKPAVISQTETEDGGVDTVYLGADKLVYFTMRMCDINPSVVTDARTRLDALNVDPVGTFRKKAAEEAAKAAEEAAKQDPNYRPGQPPKASAAPYIGPARPLRDSLAVNTAGLDSLRTALSDSLMQGRKAVADTVRNIPPMRSRVGVASRQDSLSSAVRPMKTDSPVKSDSTMMQADSLMLSDSLMVSDSTALVDSTALLPPDTTKVGFLEALGNVKIFRKDMQVVCDSLVYSDLDSLARLFNEPIVYQDIVRQYRADSISIVVDGGSLEKASLMSNAFITIQEDTSHYNQIKGTEMMAYFDEKGGLRRFDVLGGASALFFLEENGSLATVNKTDSKMLSAVFENGEIQRIYYFEQAKNDGYPVVQLSKEERTLKGYSWEPDRRPADRYAVTPLSLRPSQRESYTARPRAEFKQTDIYFPGYISDIYRQIEVRDSLRAVRERERAIAEREAAARARLDSLALADSLANAAAIAAVADSLARVDSLAAASKALADSLAVSDSLKTADSLALAKPLTPEEIRAAEKAAAKEAKAKQKEEARAAKEAERKAKQEVLEAKWAEADKRDAEKAAVKAAKKLEKERKKKRKALAEQARQQEREAALLERYRLKYEKRKARLDAKENAARVNEAAKAARKQAAIEK